MKLVYLDKKDRVRAWLGSHPVILAGTAVAAFLLLPIWHQSTSGNFILEPAKRAVVHSVVPGLLEDIYAREGTPVSAGQPLATLRNMPLQSDLAEAQSQFVVAADRATSAALHYENYGAAAQEKQSSAAKSDQLRLKAANLKIVSPIAGVVLTPQLQERVGSYLSEGTDLLEIADLNMLRARIYVSEYDMYKVQEGAPAKLRVEGIVHTWNTRATAISPVAQESDPTLMDATKFKGLHPPQFYLVELLVSGADGRLRPGMIGVARIYGRRISLLGLAMESLRILLGRKIW